MDGKGYDFQNDFLLWEVTSGSYSVTGKTIAKDTLPG